MVSVWGETLRTVAKRLASDWLIVSAAFTTILAAAILLAAGPIYAEAVTISSLRQSIDDATPTESNIDVAVDVFPVFYEDIDQRARSVIRAATGFLGADVHGHIEAGSFGFSDDGPGQLTDLASFQYFEDVESKASLVEGRWPTDDRTPYETAVNRPAASARGLEVGDLIPVVNRRDPEVEMTVVVTGIYEIDDADDPIWFGADLPRLGVSASGTFRTVGPFVVTEKAILGGLTPNRAHLSWRVAPHYGDLARGEVGRLRQSVSSLATDLETGVFSEIDRGASGSSGFTVTTGVARLLSGVDRALTVTRSSVLALLIQLAILAGYALVLTAGLLTDTRRNETHLMRSRGAGPRRVLALAILEGLALALPAALVAPPLASTLLRILNRVGPLARIDLVIDPRPTAESFALTGIAMLLSVVALAWPAWRSAHDFGKPALRSGRRGRSTGMQRVGVDIALLALAAVAFWQLQELGPELGAVVRGRFGVDPLLVVTPTLGLVAGAILGLRFVPLLARGAERFAISRKTAVAALASWQMARRPVRYARSSLLLIMAVGIGLFTASYSTTWLASQDDQADHIVGADLVVTPNRDTASSLPDLYLAASHETVPGVESSMPLMRRLGQLAGQGGVGQFLILDAAKAGDVVTMRPDLSPDFESLMGTLAAARPSLAGVAIPGQPAALRIVAEAIEEIPEDPVPCDVDQADTDTCFDARARMVVEDGDGVLHRLEAGRVTSNSGPTELVGVLSQQSGEVALRPSYPISLVAVELRYSLPELSSRSVTLRLRELSAIDPMGRARPLSADMGTDDWEVDSTLLRARTPATIALTPGDDSDGLSMQIATGSGLSTEPAYLSVRPSGTRLPETFPVVVSATFPETNFAGVGEDIRLPPLRVPGATATIAGTLSGFPTVDERLGETVIVDLPTFQAMTFEPGHWPTDIDSYWLRIDGDSDDVKADLRATPISSVAVRSRQELVDELTSDPIAVGAIGALSIGFVAAVVFAVVGFAVSATVSARDRLVEFALLRALGLSRRQMARWLVIEQGGLVVVSLLLGTVVGVVLTASMLPAITLTSDGQPAVPDVIVDYPWGSILGLEAAVLALVAIVVATGILLLRRTRIGSLIRLGED